MMKGFATPVQTFFIPLVTTQGRSVYDETNPFPSTRYQGSKNKLTNWIWDNISDLHFHTALDAFGGTGAVSHLLKRKGKCVCYNDVLKFNYWIGKALIENDEVLLSDDDIDFVVSNDTGHYKFIQKKFGGIFYTDSENAWLDRIIFNIHQMGDEYKQAMAFFALFQSCIIKRPYNLFHRANLYLRLSDVPRSFGNKTSWDRSFTDYFKLFAQEANEAVFSNGHQCRVRNADALDLDTEDFDLVYLDTPYISDKGMGTDYLDFYHFLEGIAHYGQWESMICERHKHKPIRNFIPSPWTDKEHIVAEFEKMVKKFHKSKIIISYRSNGIPSVEQLCALLRKYKNEVRVIYSRDYKYVLSHSDVKEVLVIGV